MSEEIITRKGINIRFELNEIIKNSFRSFNVTKSLIPPFFVEHITNILLTLTHIQNISLKEHKTEIIHRHKDIKQRVSKSSHLGISTLIKLTYK